MHPVFPFFPPLSLSLSLSLSAVMSQHQKSVTQTFFDVIARVAEMLLRNQSFLIYKKEKKKGEGGSGGGGGCLIKHS